MSVHSIEYGSFSWPLFASISRAKQAISGFDPEYRRVEARNKIVVENQGLIYHLAAKRIRAYGGGQFEDLAQEGQIGSFKGVEKFDPKLGNALSTYLSWWIRQAIGRYAMEDKMVRIPVHEAEAANKLAKLVRKLSSELGREPTIEELAARAELGRKKIVGILTHPKAELTLDEPVETAEGEEKKMDVPDPGSPDAQKETISRHLRADLREVLTHLSEIEKNIIRHRYGLFGATEMTLQEIGEAFNLSRERIRQIEQVALGKMRERGWAANLRDYL